MSLPSRFSLFSRLVLVAATMISFQALAGTYYVSVSGDDDNPGSLAEPYATVNHALSTLKPGDTLYLRGGTYFERVEAERSGTSGQPITIAGYKDEQATIDSGPEEFRAKGNNDWELVNAGRGEYRSKSSCDNKPVFAYITDVAGYENERVVLVPYEDESDFRATTDSYGGSNSSFYVGPGVMEIAGRCHIRLAKTSALRDAEARYGRVIADENANPSDYGIVMSQATSTLTVSGAYLTFKDITFNQAKRTIILDAGAQHVRFEGITAWLGASTIQTYSSQVHHITITGSRILGDAPRWIFWSDMKNPPQVANQLRSTSINLKGGTYDWTIERNLIRGSGQDLIGTNNGEHGIFVHHNRIENCGDDAFEIEGKAEDGGRDDIGHIQIYENYISNCLVAVAVGQDTRKMTGPLLFYRNVVAMLRDHPVNRKVGINSWNGGERFGYHGLFKQAGRDYAARNVHYYNNTLVMLNAKKGVTPTPTNPDGSTFANNIIAMVNNAAVDEYNIGSDQLIDGNLYWKLNALDGDALVSGKDSVEDLESIEQRSISSESKGGRDPRFMGFSTSLIDDQSGARWSLSAKSEMLGPASFMLDSSSPARGSAVPVTCRKVGTSDAQGRSLCSGGKLPDSRAAADIGAIPAQASASDYRAFPFVFGSTPESEPLPATPSESPPGAPVLKVSER